MLEPVFGKLPILFLEELQQKNIKPWQGKQVLHWLYHKFVNQPEMMTDLSNDFRLWLRSNYDFYLPIIVKQQNAKDKTTKLLLKLSDNNQIEMVIISDKKKKTLCISTQVGCKRGCKICATGKMGFIRSLYSFEIVSQVVIANQLVAPERITNIVFMGMGEPLDNLDNVLLALRIIQSEMGISLSPRKSTISTCGIVPGILKLADSGIKTKLAVSLNSAVDTTRSELMPINMIYPLKELISALQYFNKKNPYRITFEYVMIPDVNISKRHSDALISFIRNFACKVNLIPWNPGASFDWKAPNYNEIESFQLRLRKSDKAITIRKSKGFDILAACGQLTINNIKD